MSQTDGVSNALKTFNKVVDEVLKYPAGPQRWRAAHDLLWLNLSWKNQQTYKEVAAENSKIRKLVDKHGIAIGATKAEKADKTLRNALSIPHGAYYTIQRADPELFKRKEDFKKFAKTFPEYMTRDAI